ncbi:MAG TPA: hypothetical protein VGC77_04640 [Rhodopseudomonas sp.]|uniref:hypothetical protein n=1 Tax=Rhodopseudomonas sp. TaxID=1078 RepID=UPI002ED9E310
MLNNATARPFLLQGKASAATGEIPGVFQLNDEGIHMPAFTFEKISPPARGGPSPKPEKKQRGLIIQILDRFVDARRPHPDADESTGEQSPPR